MSERRCFTVERGMTGFWNVRSAHWGVVRATVITEKQARKHQQRLERACRKGAAIHARLPFALAALDAVKEKA